jgi:hypothetical protein
MKDMKAMKIMKGGRSSGSFGFARSARFLRDVCGESA